VTAPFCSTQSTRVPRIGWIDWLVVSAIFDDHRGWSGRQGGPVQVDVQCLLARCTIYIYRDRKRTGTRSVHIPYHQSLLSHKHVIMTRTIMIPRPSIISIRTSSHRLSLTRRTYAHVSSIPHSFSTSPLEPNTRSSYHDLQARLARVQTR